MGIPHRELHLHSMANDRWFFGTHPRGGLDARLRGVLLRSLCARTVLPSWNVDAHRHNAVPCCDRAPLDAGTPMVTGACGATHSRIPLRCVRRACDRLLPGPVLACLDWGPR